MQITRLVLFLITTSLAFGFDWMQMPYDYAGLLQDNHGGAGGGGGGGNCQDGKCPTMVRPKSNCFAQNAAKAAKAASDAQVEAGALAAHQVQKLLADKAGSAAKAAEAAFVGKQLLVEQIESELREGRQVVAKEKARLHGTKTTAVDARQGVKQASDEVKALTELLRKAHDGLAHLERVVAGAHQAVADQKQAVAEVRKRMELLVRQVELARVDYQSTKTAAENAASAAQEARQKTGRGRRMSYMPYLPSFQQTFYLDEAPSYSASS